LSLHILRRNVVKPKKNSSAKVRQNDCFMLTPVLWPPQRKWGSGSMRDGRGSDFADNLSRRIRRTNRSDAMRGGRLIRARTVRIFVEFTVTAALISSLLIDHFGWFRKQLRPLNSGRIIDGLPLVGGINLIAKF
jgi:hypothetical protein